MATVLRKSPLRSQRYWTCWISRAWFTSLTGASPNARLVFASKALVLRCRCGHDRWTSTVKNELSEILRILGNADWIFEFRKRPRGKWGADHLFGEQIWNNGMRGRKAIGSKRPAIDTVAPLPVAWIARADWRPLRYMPTVRCSCPTIHKIVPSRPT